MAEMLAQQEAADRAKREAQRQQALAYQQALDQQVNELRQRSFDSLQSTSISLLLSLCTFVVCFNVLVCVHTVCLLYVDPACD